MYSDGPVVVGTLPSPDYLLHCDFHGRLGKRYIKKNHTAGLFVMDSFSHVNHTGIRESNMQ